MTYDPADVRAAQEHFGFARPAPIEKDWHILRAMRAIIGVGTGPFRLVFAGGTCLARAHKLVYRMSEDVDFKIAPADGSPVSKSKRRKDLGSLRERITESLRAAGFPLDPADSAQFRSRDDNRYTLYQLPYGAPGGPGDPLRPTIQVELNYVALRLPTVRLPVASFIAEAFGRSPEVPDIACVSVDETAGEKLISLTRRTAMELADLGRDPDPTLVRHIYDLHVTREHYDSATVANLAREIMPLDAEEFGNQFPAYRNNPMDETRRALAALTTDSRYERRYAEFLDLMVYGDKPAYNDAVATVSSLIQELEAA
jgi:predicted nucleotidyltransferase component of viral defense system